MEVHTQLTALALTLVAQEPAHDTSGFVREHRAAHAALEAGQLNEARALFRRCLELSPENATIAYAQACVAARAGAPAAAPFDTGMKVEALDLHPDGKRLATGHASKSEKSWLRIWDLETRELLWEEDAKRWDPETGGWMTYAVRDVRFSPSGAQLAASSVSSGRVAVFDTDTGERRWCSDHLGGRMGEPVGLRWAPGGERLWFCFESGVLGLWTVDLAHDWRLEKPTDARPPAISPSGLAALVDWEGVALVDANTGQVRWARPSLGRPGWIVQAGTGHFDGDADPVGLELQRGAHTRGRLGLGALVEQLHDPKRVRAAMGGVGLVKPELD